ncbi:GntR family transcriptional regulator [Tessaracoccus oleiagri]|uniref:DNA-binding transcriptional regulator YhcF, GntR family n=1 Tax=Tessaracoccus oleiagri TaxID=686624 RepID=A0A1G9LS63_9ACTN|nr:GntR family transcriptional regulator [Tessaracoccus oleiagri]SDL64614.1 DNA-binding transcriptional regulator YhcF, GntR family [Tessaracoccus oleiagri]
MEFNSSAPIWLQLVDECSRRIVTGQWPAGTRVPGVRDLGVELGVNPNTMQRALAELDRQGITVPDRTVGRFVTDDTARIDELRDAVAAGSADDFIQRARGLGMSLEGARKLLTNRWPDLEGNA